MALILVNHPDVRGTCGGVLSAKHPNHPGSSNPTLGEATTFQFGGSLKSTLPFSLTAAPSCTGSVPSFGSTGNATTFQFGEKWWHFQQNQMMECYYQQSSEQLLNWIVLQPLSCHQTEKWWHYSAEPNNGVLPAELGVADELDGAAAVKLPSN
jgi:hypothetical protein